MPEMTTTKLMLSIGQCLNKAFEAINNNNDDEAEQVLNYILRRWLKERPLTLHTEN